MNLLRVVGLGLLCILTLCRCSGPATDRAASADPSDRPETAGPIDVEEAIARSQELVGASLRNEDSQGFLEAERLLRSVLEVDPNNEKACMSLGRIYCKLETFPETEVGDRRRFAPLADAMFERALAIGEPRAEEYLEVAKLLAGRGPDDLARAVDLLTRALALDPDDPEIRLTTGICYYNMDEYEKAKAALSAMIGDVASSSDPNDLFLVKKAQMFLGRTYMELGETEHAEAALTEAVDGLQELNEQREWYWGCPYKALGVFYSKMGEREEAAEALMAAADGMPRNVSAQYNASVACFRVGAYVLAKAYATRAIALDARWKFRAFRRIIAARSWLAGLGEGDANPALGDDDPIFSTALRHFNSGDYTQAARAVRPALSSDDADPRYRVLGGFVYLLRKQYEKADRLFRAVLQTSPDDLGARVGLAHLLLIRRDFDGAAQSLERAVNEMRSHNEKPDPAIDPVADYRWFVYRMACLGAAWTHAGRHENEKALRYYNRILARRQDDRLATLGKADALLALERTDDAELLFARVLKDEPDNQYALAGMAIIKLNRGELDEAEDDFERAASLAGRNFTCPYEGLGLVYLRQGKTEKAKESFEKAIEINPDVDTRKFNELARIYVREQRYAEAEKLLLKSIENDPQNREAIKLLKTVREAAARTERANAPAGTKPADPARPSM